jgi:hypothetical protein
VDIFHCVRLKAPQFLKSWICLDRYITKRGERTGTGYLQGDKYSHCQRCEMLENVQIPLIAMEDIFMTLHIL